MNSVPIKQNSPDARSDKLPLWAIIIAILCIAQTLKWGIAGPPEKPHWATFETGVLLGINKWNMFDRPSQIESGWYETRGHLQSGEEIDVLQNKKIIPGDLSGWALHPANKGRWWKYFENLSRSDYSKYRQYYADYACRRWNETHAPAEKLARVTLIFMREEILLNYIKSPPQPVLLLEKNCP